MAKPANTSATPFIRDKHASRTAWEASMAKPANLNATPFIRFKHASGAAWDNKKTPIRGRRKEIRIIRQKALLPVLGSSVFYYKQEVHIKPNYAKRKATQTPKPVALVMGSGKNSEGGLEYGWGSNEVLDSLGGASNAPQLVRPV